MLHNIICINWHCYITIEGSLKTFITVDGNFLSQTHCYYCTKMNDYFLINCVINNIAAGCLTNKHWLQPYVLIKITIVTMSI